MLNRRKLITGLISFVAAPAIVRASSLMPVKVMDSFDQQETLGRVIRIRLPSDFKVIDHPLSMLEITGIGYKDFYANS